MSTTEYESNNRQHDDDRSSCNFDSSPMKCRDSGEYNYDFHCSFLESLPAPAKDIISWRCPYRTGAIIAAVIALSVMVKSMSFVAVIAYIGLLFIAASTVLRLYSSLGSGSDVGHPLQQFLEHDVQRYLAGVADVIQWQTASEDSALQRAIAYLRDIFLLNSYADAAKFFCANVALIYVGMIVNLTDLVLLLSLVLLTGPKLYSMYRNEIDAAVANVRERVMTLVDLAKDKIAHLPVVGNGGKAKQL